MTKKDRMKIFENYSIYAITDEKHSLGRDNVSVAKKILESGVKIIQYRVKYMDFADKYLEAQEIARIAKKHNAVFIVNDHPDLALMVKADGVHLGQDDYPVKEVRKLVGKDFIIGVSTHKPEQYIKAVRDGADYAGVGPLFETHTKDNVMAPVGLKYLKWVVNHKKIPFVAIGGIKSHNIADIVRAGAKCFCLVTEITESKDINKKIKELNKIIYENKGI